MIFKFQASTVVHF